MGAQEQQARRPDTHSNGAGGEDSAPPPRHEPAPSSAVARIKARREGLRQRKHLDLKVPGYGGELGVRYKSVLGDKITRRAAELQEAKREKRPYTDTAAAILIECCEAILAREDEDGDLEPLLDEQERPHRFDVDLVEVLDLRNADGSKPEKAREIVYALFSPDRNQDLAIDAHAGSVVAFLQGNDAAIDEELLGE